MDLEEMTDEELNTIRKATLEEQGRRAKVEEGKENIGQVVREYSEAARIECPDLPDAELGEYVVGLITEDYADA